MYILLILYIKKFFCAFMCFWKVLMNFRGRRILKERGVKNI